MVRGRRGYVWNAVRDDYIRQNAGLMKDQKLADEMTRIFGYPFSMVAVRLRRRSLGIQKENGRGRCEIKKKEIKKK